MITLVSTAPVPANQWHHVFAHLRRLAARPPARRCYVDGKPLDDDGRHGHADARSIADRRAAAASARTHGG